MRRTRKVKRQWDFKEVKQEEALRQQQQIEEAENADPTDWAEIWYKMHGSPTKEKRLIIRDDDEWLISTELKENTQN